jgi:hypothetical protein
MKKKRPARGTSVCDPDWEYRAYPGGRCSLGQMKKRRTRSGPFLDVTIWVYSLENCTDLFGRERGRVEVEQYKPGAEDVR